MGSYISVGIVYSDDNICKINNDLLPIVKNLLRFCDNIFVNYPKDDCYENWEEKLFKGEKELVEAFTILSKKTMSSGKICCKIHNNDYNIIVSLRGEKDLIKGVLFEIPEKELLQDDFSSRNLNDITNNIVSELIELWENTEYSYAFCDSEVDIEYQLFEIKQSKEPIYSVLILKDNLNHPVIKLSPWCIDGITRRISQMK